MTEPGGVYEIPARLAQPPQAAHRYDPAHREKRWILVISTPEQCIDPSHLTVFAVLLSAQIEFAAGHDVLIFRGECVREDSMAQADLLFTIAKSDLTGARYRGTVTADTLLKVRAAVARLMGFA